MYGHERVVGPKVSISIKRCLFVVVTWGADHDSLHVEIEICELYTFK